MTGAPSSIPKPQPSSGGDVTSSSSGSSGGSGRSVRLFAFLCLVGVPYLVGIFISQTNIDEIREIVRPIIDIVVPPIHSTLRFLQPKQQDDEPPSSSFNQPSTNTLNYIDGEACYERFMNFVQRNLGSNDSNPLEQLQFELYRHGEPEPCGNVVTPNNNIQNNFKQFFLEAYANNNECNDDLFEQKYLFENLVTQMIHYTYQGSTCHSKEKERTPKDGFYGFCDMGEARTPILSDHKQLRPITTTTQKGGPKTYLPCHFHDEYGVRVASLSHLIQMARDAINNKKQTNHPTSTTDCSIGMDGQYTDDCHRTRTELQFYAVPAGRVFIHSAKYVGQIIQLPHVSGGDPEKPVYMKVISTQPKVFDVFNFFTHAESDDLVQRALAETSETHRIKRSSTGATGYNLNDRRTSESGYDTNGATSVEVKKYVLSSSSQIYFVSFQRKTCERVFCEETMSRSIEFLPHRTIYDSTAFLFFGNHFFSFILIISIHFVSGDALRY